MFRKAQIASIVALSLSGAFFTAQANIINLSLAGDVSADATGVPDLDSALSTSSFDINANNANFDFSDSANANSRANSDGWFYNTSSSNASTFGAFAAASVTQTYEVTNTGPDQFFEFEFNVMNGSLDVNCYSDEGYGDGDGYGNEIEIANIVSEPVTSDCLSGEEGFAGYTASIMTLGGDLLWSSAASIELSGGLYSFAEAGTSLGGNASGNSYNWGPATFTLDLGLIAAGDVFGLIYNVTTSSISAPSLLPDVGTAVNAYAQFGDPNSFNSQLPTFNSNPANVVNSPTTIALMGLALVGLAGSARRQRRS